MKTIVIVSRDLALASNVERLLRGRHRTVSFSHIEPAIDFFSNGLPDLVILDIKGSDQVSSQVFTNLKEDPLFSALPVLAVFPAGEWNPHWDGFFIEDYIREADLERDLRRRVDLCIGRSERIVEINPLTRLPGNISINRTIQERLDRGESFALAYADLDYFKPFNDRYGFTRGDDVIRITGRLILGIVKSTQTQGSFVGHIGGDDFVYMMSDDLIEKASGELIDAFDRIIPTFYDAEDREKGCISSVDRQGTARAFPFVGVSVGITSTGVGHFAHFGEVTERASEMKKYAKQFQGSCFKSDRRQKTA